MRALQSEHIKYFIKCRWVQRVRQGLLLVVRLDSDSQLNTEETEGWELCTYTAGPPDSTYSNPLLRTSTLLFALRQSCLFSCNRPWASVEAVGAQLRCAQALRSHHHDGLSVPCAQPYWQKGADNPALASSQSSAGTCLQSKGLPRSDKTSILCQSLPN